MSNANNMSALDIARRLAELGQAQEAAKAYTLALGSAQGQDPETELECALNILQLGGNYLVAYDTFRSLYGRGEFAEDCLSVMTQAFYTPNEKLLKSRYEKNCKLLSKYPYLFRKDFPAFEELPLRFYPYDDNRYLPFSVKDGQFGDLIEPNETVISRNFFRDLSKPVLASDVFSMYELEYLNDNIRKSEWVGYENHIYLHYSDWTVFCAYLQILNLREILKDEKIVFLMGEELSRYPIDFKAEFGKDYSKYPLKPVAISEYNRLIWHTQLSSSNGGDFFNEIFDSHPNLIVTHSVILHDVNSALCSFRDSFENGTRYRFTDQDSEANRKLAKLEEELKRTPHRTDRHLLTALLLAKGNSDKLDPAARIVPAIFFQPHFHSLYYSITADEQSGRAILNCGEYEEIVNFPAFKQFKYIKTFTPMRRPTTSTASTIRFMLEASINQGQFLLSNALMDRILNRSYMVDRAVRLFKDSVIVRFEDAKLSPKATFTALAAFLDLPYTESMTYCSLFGVKNASSGEGNVLGFDTSTVYRTYDDYMGKSERYFMEYFLRDAYEYYGYDFHYYDGQPMNADRVAEVIKSFDVFIRHYLDSYNKILSTLEFKPVLTEERRARAQEEMVEEYAKKFTENCQQVAETLLKNYRFVNKQGRPLKMTPLLQLDPELLENPLYR